eukprot:GEMP01069837.1.p1 GENE.GEMP01069837.1~~GEMP01069837.1.p1  ORF type:complete len:269 (+),score=48.08 GEMP01069837.1:61-867(+)
MDRDIGADIADNDFAVKGYTAIGFKEVQRKANVNIVGYDSQLLEIKVPPGQQVMFEPGSFQHASKNFKIGIEMYGGCGDGCKRACCAREPCCFMSIKNESSNPDIVGLTPNFPAHVLPIDLSDPKRRGMYFKNGSLLGFMSNNFKMTYEFAGCFRGLCGGFGCCYQKLEGTGFAYLNAGGFCFEKNLAPGEEVVVDESAVVTWDNTVKFELITAGGCLTCCCGGEGLFLAKFTGPGSVTLQTMSFEQYKAAVYAYGKPAPKNMTSGVV